LRIKRSYIITAFGVWELHSLHHTDIDKALQKKIEKISNKLYFESEEGLKYVKQPVKNYVKYLNHVLSGLLKVKFMPYE